MAQRKNRKKPRGLGFERMMAVERISRPAVSPDGSQVAYTAARPDLEANKIRHVVRLLDLKTLRDRVLTPGPGDHKDPAWSPDGRWLAFVSDRDEKAGEQLWILPAEGGEARCVTKGYGGVLRPIWAPDSRRIAFARKVVVSGEYRPRRGEEPDPRQGPSNAAVFGLVHPKSSARIADELLFRHWDRWRDRRRNHLFLADAVTGRLRDLTPFDCDIPPLALGSDQDFDFCPDGREIAYVMNPDEVVARSTNNSIFLQKLNGLRPDGEPVCISETEACDFHPRYGPDGRSVFYLGMEVPGYEADKPRIKRYERETGETRVYLDGFDRSPEAFIFAEHDGGASVFFSAQDRGYVSIYHLDAETGRVVQHTQGTCNSFLAPIPGGADLLVIRETTTRPAELHRLTLGSGIRPVLRNGGAPGPAAAVPVPAGKVRGSAGKAPGPVVADAGCTAERLTRNADVLAGVEMNEAEEFWYPGAGDVPVHGFLIKPAGFDAAKKYPLILLIHGGPQSAFLDHFHYRWNAQVFASEGAVVAMINPRGSTGYGQRFTDQISGDWGGRCYTDLMRGVDHLIATHRFLDPSRLAAAGASFGGFMINWIAGHTDRFCALVSHDGVFFAETMAYTTEELWFDEHEHGGLPHENRKTYLKYSPHLHVDRFRTPTLVVQGSEDFRCPVSEGIGMFTALQVKGVPSRFLYFSDEGHWVLKVANAQVWYREVLGWLMQHLG